MLQHTKKFMNIIFIPINIQYLHEQIEFAFPWMDDGWKAPRMFGTLYKATTAKHHHRTSPLCTNPPLELNTELCFVHPPHPQTI